MEILVNCEECIGKDISFSYRSAILENEIKLYQSTFDSSGRMLIKLPNKDTLGLALNVKDGDSTHFFTYLYLQPNTHIEVSFEKNAVQFSGDLATVNNYLSDFRNIDNRRTEYRNVWTTEKDRFKSKDSLENYLTIIRSFGAEFDKKVLSDASLSAYEKDFLQNINTGFETYRRLDFDFFKLLADRHVYYDNDDDKQIIRHQDSLTKSYISGLTINTHLLKYNGSFYNWYLNIDDRMLEMQEVYYDETEEVTGSGMYQYLKKTVRSNPQLAPYYDFILSNLIISGYSLSGIVYDDLFQMISAFRKDYPRSKYLPELEQKLDEYDKLKPGSPLKDFSMLDVNGKTFRLSDLKGKLVYVDIWATWCGPCIEEFPYSKKLAKRYRDNKDLVFLYVSQDGNSEAWKKYLKKNPALKGIHGNQPPRKDDTGYLPDSNSVYFLYKVGGIPSYILIGKDGRIIDYNAARPSQLVENKYLDSLLAI